MREDKPDPGPEEGYSTFTEEEYETAAAIHNMDSNRSRFAD
jgi:hypothetical protein